MNLAEPTSGLESSIDVDSTGQDGVGTLSLVTQSRLGLWGSEELLLPDSQPDDLERRSGSSIRDSNGRTRRGGMVLKSGRISALILSGALSKRRSYPSRVSYRLKTVFGFLKSGSRRLDVVTVRHQADGCLLRFGRPAHEKN